MKTGILKHWNEQLEGLAPRATDVYFREEYLSLYANKEQQPLCAYARDERGIMLLPYLDRSFVFEGKLFREQETAYGYGGPVCSTEDPAFKADAARAIFQLMVEEGYLVGFVRFHPLLENYRGMEGVGRIIDGQQVVVMDLSGGEDEIWMREIHRKNRSAIRRSERDGLCFEADYAFDYLPDFVRLYGGTMDKLNAERFYYFPESYYRQIRDGLPGSFLGVVKAGGEVAASAIFFRSGPYGHYHLSGSNPAFLAQSPNNLLLWKAALELKSQGVELFHLGGGTTTDPEDSLFLFKHRFSSSVRTHRIGKFVYQPEAYERICADWEQKNPDKIARYGNYVLKYKF